MNPWHINHYYKRVGRTVCLFCLALGLTLLPMVATAGSPPVASVSPSLTHPSPNQGGWWMANDIFLSADLAQKPWPQLSLNQNSLTTDVKQSPLKQGPKSEVSSALAQGIQHYQAGQFVEAVKDFQTAVQQAQTDSDRAQGLIYLSLSYQKLGQWQPASQTITSSLALTQASEALQAQALNAQAHLALATGQTQVALDTWQKATQAYRRAGDDIGVLGSLINQAQALQVLGFYQDALTQLEQVAQILKTQADSPLKAAGLRSLGNALRVVGDLKQAQTILTESLTMTQGLKDPESTIHSLLSLGGLLQSQAEAVNALDYVTVDRREAARLDANRALSLFQDAERLASTAPLTNTPLLRTQALLNQVSLLMKTGQELRALDLLPTLQAALATLPPSRASVYSHIQLVQGLTMLKTSSRPTIVNATPSWLAIAQLATTATQQANALGDSRAQVHALGNLAYLYEQTQQWQPAQELTEQALLLSQAIKANDSSYRWQWQLGRIYTATGNRQGALSAYAQAVGTLQTLRRDLVAINPDIQFSFRDSVEPIYRNYVSLLLQPTLTVAGSDNAEQANLVAARNAIESLQLAEIENFLRQACLTGKAVQIDQVDPTAAVLYPIILPDRLEVILSLPDQPLRHYATAIPQPQLTRTLTDLRAELTDRTSDQFLPIAQQAYDWLIRPALADLAQAQIKTLVFVLDGPLRNIPIATLHDGEHYLIEQFGVAITPGLQLIDVKPLKREGLTAVLAGLTEARQGFSALPNVGIEINTISQELHSQVLLNDQFVTKTLKQEINTFNAPIVHLATHGEFSSNASDTFVLTWDDRLDINQLTAILQQQSTNPDQAIELLVLSACRTALGDSRAALGLSGMAVRAGARSTIGSLWYVDDAAATALMVDFYKYLSTQPKAEALRRAQITLISGKDFNHPYYWSPFILVGNWL